jgi:DNA primase
MSVIDEVKQKLDIVEVVSQHITLTKAGRNFKASFRNGRAGTVSGPVAPAVMSSHFL